MWQKNPGLKTSEVCFEMFMGNSEVIL